MAEAVVVFFEGGWVAVHSHGDERAAIGRVRLVSDTQRAIVVVFDDKPPFAVVKGGGVAFIPGSGLALLAHREDVGPWVELFGGGHYEIERAAKCSKCGRWLRLCCDIRWQHLDDNTAMCEGARALMVRSEAEAGVEE